ncbi:MAG: hypothetical protein ACRC9Y_08270 [Aeromonas veronii]
MVELRMAGETSPQQKIWEAIINMAGAGTGSHVLPVMFMPGSIAKISGQELGVVKSYMARLVKGEYLSWDGKSYTLNRHCGVKAPELNPDGSVDVSDLPLDMLWQHLRFNAVISLNEIFGLLDSENVSYNHRTIRRYLSALEGIGMLWREGANYRVQPGAWQPRRPLLRRSETVTLLDAYTGQEVWRAGSETVASAALLAQQNKQMRELLQGWVEEAGGVFGLDDTHAARVFRSLARQSEEVLSS